MNTAQRDEATPENASKKEPIYGYRIVKNKKGWKYVRTFPEYAGRFPCNRYPQLSKSIDRHNNELRKKSEAAIEARKTHNKKEREKYEASMKSEDGPNYEPKYQLDGSKRLRQSADERFTLALMLIERADAIWEKQMGHQVTAGEVHRLIEPFNQMARGLNLRGKEKEAIKRIMVAQLRSIATEMRKAA